MISSKMMSQILYVTFTNIITFTNSSMLVCVCSVLIEFYLILMQMLRSDWLTDRTLLATGVQ